ncbi:nuclear transport factor 2 family protein [Shewanella insulae]|uniref:nuclear transport factor 2 family protein n=1 Tax=Shewanella insulae TaxID=2681496 RepID=UPI001EFE274D|nr:nuclear transport factor 2 family protein [Shewanella insulae]MCG9713315.1 nuclear transport factor 2 family protein [Shewanella insulae]MCG9737662.1 nuclear transport factor 2 family protein [Shewanella insulae]MCG9755866.1 nuclear transport factor 2 family protein [Shewanella insulae]
MTARHPMLTWLLAASALLLSGICRAEPPLEATQTLDKLHSYAASADWDNYFALYTEDAHFIGTDAKENWDMAEFSAYARPTKGWTYTLDSRQLAQHGDVIVFDEHLSSKSYGKCRGTGTLVLTPEGWKILQYHLSFPIPNAMAKRITAQISAANQEE